MTGLLQLISLLLMHQQVPGNEFQGNNEFAQTTEFPDR
jgi:hypothetical protein